MASLRLADDNDSTVDSDLFASPSTTPAPKSTNKTSQSHAPKQSKQDAEDARNAQLSAELERIREVNRVIEGVTASLTKAKENMSTVHQTVSNASTLLATWTRILSQTEHNQRLVLNPSWQGATQDLEDQENEGARRQVEEQRRAQEEVRRREEEQRRREEEERRQAMAPAVGTRGGTRGRGSVRGAASSGRGYTGVGGQTATSRGRGTTSTRGTSGVGRTASTRGRGRGLG
jgi:hypothetical protein